MQDFQWAYLSENQIIIGDKEGGFAIAEPDHEVLEYIHDKDFSSISSTKAILEGALHSALEENKKYQDSGKSFYSALPRYIWMLIGAYHSANATPGAMRFVSQKMISLGRENVAEYLEHVAVEESGHSDLALMDLSTIGLDALDLVGNVKSKETQNLLDHLNRILSSHSPIKILGYAFALERMALFNTESTLKAVKKVLPFTRDALKCLRVHSSVGSETSHVDDSIEFISQLPSEDRRVIVQCCYETALVMTKRYYLSEQEISQRINPYFKEYTAKQA